ncbi:hypothetical protein Ancab_035332 [Ancistrocladus abbreviatus]
MSQTNWEADKMLDVYIHDYFVKRKLHASAKAFQQEGKVSTDPVAIDAPGGFLFEWWSVFWDIFIARSNEKHSEPAAFYIETQISKAREQHQKSQQHNMQIQQLLLQRHAQQQQQQQQQQQRGDGTQLLNGSANGIATTDPLMRQNPVAANALATKMYEEKLKLPLQRDPSEVPAMKQRFGDNMGQLVDPNHATMLKTAAVGGQAPGQALHGTGGIPGNSQQFQCRSQQLPLSAQDVKSEMNPIMNARAAGPEGSLIGVPGSNPGGNNLTLKGWPLTGLDPMRNAGILSHQKPMIQSPQPFHNPQLQQQLLFQAPQNLASPSAMDLETRRLRMVLNNQNMGLGKDGQLNPVGEVVPNVGSPVQVGCPVLPHGDADMLIKQQMQNSQPQQLNSQNPLSNQQSQIANQVHQLDKMGVAGSMTVEASVSNSFRGNDQASKNQMGRKRKQPVSSSGPANSSGTANTAGPSPSSAPSTPSTHTPGDVMSLPTLSNNGGSSKPSIIFGSDSVGTLASANNQLRHNKCVELQTDIGRFVDDATLDDNVESFLSQEEGGDPRESIVRGMDVSKDLGFTFKDIALIQASTNKVNCCHFSSDGRLLATGGHDKKAVLWVTDTRKLMSTLEEHTHTITDVRFAPSMSRLATSSFDKTVRVWEAENTSYSLRNFTGHSTSVMSVDFHPNKDDLICSCDGNGEIRYWSITHGSCLKVFEGGMTQVRFQPHLGKYLAAAAESVVSILDVETQASIQTLQGHTQKVVSVCWSPSGEVLASMSEDLVRVWAVGSGSKWQCIHELNRSGNKFNSCVFHPVYPSLLIIGCYQNLELWNMVENKTWTLMAHEGLITSLAASTASGVVASASQDKCVKLWK